MGSKGRFKRISCRFKRRAGSAARASGVRALAFAHRCAVGPFQPVQLKLHVLAAHLRFRSSGERHGHASLGVVSYEPRLRLLAEYLQQLVMESLGKSTTLDGGPVEAPTSPLVFGGAGTDLQHSLFQALHQGTTRHPVMLVGCAEEIPGLEDWQREQLAHLLAQASVLVNGRPADSHERSLPGNNPVLLMLARELDPATLGELLATFEHAVYLLGTSWNVNPFDQWGVEEGKRVAAEFRDALQGDGGSPDEALSGTIDWLVGRG